jgi:hypothetical protein
MAAICVAVSNEMGAVELFKLSHLPYQLRV